MCRIQGFNNLFSADFIPFIPGSRSLVRQEVDGDRGQRNLAGMRLKRRGRKTHGPTLLKQRGLSCNEERVSRRGRFLFFLQLQPLSSLPHQRRCDDDGELLPQRRL